jgi:hypothetical protein
MRFIAFLLVALAFSAPADAQAWKDYTSSDYGFTVSFPTDPEITNSTFQAVDGRTVPARVWTVTRNKNIFKVTVADLANTGLQESAVIDHAIRTLSQGGEVKVNFPHRIYQVYGRQISIVGQDGSRETAAVFDYNGRLYQIEAKMLPGGDDTDVIRFQQSLIFTDRGSNRPQDTIQAIRQACRGVVNNPAGIDDPRCQKR